MEKIPNIHPGEILLEEFLIPMGITAYRLSKDIGIPQTRVSEILKGNRRITADTALRLAKYFGISPNSGLACRTIMILKKSWLRRKKSSILSIQYKEKLLRFFSDATHFVPSSFNF